MVTRMETDALLGEWLDGSDGGRDGTDERWMGAALWIIIPITEA